MIEERQLSLDKFANGAILEKFNQELEKVSANIYDPNTSSTAKRTITMKLEIKPDEGRELGNTEIIVTSKLAPSKSVPTKLVFGYDNHHKKGVAKELKADMLGQIDLDELEQELKEKAESTPNNIVDLQA